MNPGLGDAVRKFHSSLQSVLFSEMPDVLYATDNPRDRSSSLRVFLLTHTSHPPSPRTKRHPRPIPLPIQSPLRLDRSRAMGFLPDEIREPSSRHRKLCRQYG